MEVPLPAWSLAGVFFLSRALAGDLSTGRSISAPDCTHVGVPPCDDVSPATAARTGSTVDWRH